MSDSNPLRPLLLSLALTVAGATAVLGLPPLAGGPSLNSAIPVAAAPAVAPAAAAAVEELTAQSRVQPTPLPPVAEVLRDQQAAGLDCALSAGAVPICVHGEDLQPAQRHVAGATGGTTPTSGSIGCYGTGTDGPRVRAVYARPQSAPDRYTASLPSIRGWAAGVSRQFDTSAVRTNGRRHVRFATTAGSGCTVNVLNVVLPDAAFSTFRDTIDALEARGLDAPLSKYLVWADTSKVCGLATTYADDSPGLDNLNNGHLPSYARVDRGCWGKVEAHELVHMLGGVQTSARNSTGGFHCSDGLEVMCYDDGSSRSTQRSVCSKDHSALLDCRNDDYFSTSAPAGSYLQTHWNTARSSFLSATLSDPAPAPTTPRPSPTSAAPSPSPSATPAALLPKLPVVAGLPTLAPAPAVTSSGTSSVIAPVVTGLLGGANR